MIDEKQLCFFSIMRYVPDPIRDEPKNIGVLVVAPDTGFLGVRFDLSKTHLPIGSQKLDGLQAAVGAYRSLPDRLGSGALGRDLLVSLHDEATNSIQFTQPNAAIARPSELVQQLFRERVALRHPGRSAFTASAAMAKFSSNFRRLGISQEYLIPRPTIRVGNDRYDFDIAVKNGKWVAVVQVVSFMTADMLRSEQKAGWFAHLWPQAQDSIGAEGHAVLEQPVSGTEAGRRFDRVKGWLTDSGVTLHPPEEIASVAEHIASVLATG